MERRAFLRLISLAAAAVGLPLPAQNDSLPEAIVEKAAEISGLINTQIVALQLERIRPTIQQLFERDDEFFKFISKEIVK